MKKKKAKKKDIVQAAQEARETSQKLAQKAIDQMKEAKKTLNMIVASMKKHL